MNVFKKSFILIFLVSFGIQSAMAQEKAEPKISKSQNQVGSDEEVAKQQTENLNQLVSLNPVQTSKVYSVYLDLQKRLSAKSTFKMDKNQRIAYAKDLKAIGNSQLKKILSEDQFTTFLEAERIE